MSHDIATASQAVLAATLRQTDDLERRIEAACATGDQLRFGEITALDPELRAALHEAIAPGAHSDKNAPAWTDLRFEAGIALCEAHDPAGMALTETLAVRDRRFDACKALSRLPHEDVRRALFALTRKMFIPWTDRLVASGACAVLGDREGARFFERTLVSRWFAARRAMALHLLGELRHPEAYAILTSLLDAARDPARAVAIRALGHLGDHRAVATLEALLPSDGAESDISEDVRYALHLLSPHALGTSTV